MTTDQLLHAKTTAPKASRIVIRLASMLAICIGAAITYGSTMTVAAGALPIALSIALALEMVGPPPQGEKLNPLPFAGLVVITAFVTIIAAYLLGRMVPMIAPQTQILPDQYAEVSATLDDAPTADLRARRRALLAQLIREHRIDQRGFATYMHLIERDSVDREIARATP